MSNETQQTHPRPDPLIDEVRQLRKELSDRFDNDVSALGRHLQEQERETAKTRSVRYPSDRPNSNRAG